MTGPLSPTIWAVHALALSLLDPKRAPSCDDCRMEPDTIQTAILLSLARDARCARGGVGAGVDDVRAVGEPVNDGLSQAGVGKDLGPFAEGQVGGDDPEPRSWRSESTWKTSSAAPSGSAR